MRWGYPQARVGDGSFFWSIDNAQPWHCQPNCSWSGQPTCPSGSEIITGAEWSPPPGLVQAALDVPCTRCQCCRLKPPGVQLGSERPQFHGQHWLQQFPSHMPTSTSCCRHYQGTHLPSLMSSCCAWGPPAGSALPLCRQLLIHLEPRHYRQEPLFKYLCCRHGASIRRHLSCSHHIAFPE